MHPDDLKRVYVRWIEMWNGQTDLADELVAPGCPIHQPPNEFRGPAGVRQMFEMGRAPFREITFRVEVEPIIEGDRLAARWACEAVYENGIPGATVPPGTPITFGGIDIWRVEDGKIAEYWVSSDGLHLMAQLGVA
jgi:predicted ester cyclase